MPVFRPTLRAVIRLLLLASPAQATALETAMAAVHTVHSADAEDRFLGSAFLWGDGAVAVSNAHVVGLAQEIRLTDAAGHQQIGRVIAADPSRDVAVIAVKPGQGGLIPAAAPPRQGDEVWALGAPLDIAFTATAGHISALGRQTDPATPIRMIQHAAALNPGSSGGPLVDNTGALIGMNAQIADGSRMFVGIAYAIPSADLTPAAAPLTLRDLGTPLRRAAYSLQALGLSLSNTQITAVTPPTPPPSTQASHRPRSSCKSTASPPPPS